MNAAGAPELFDGIASASVAHVGGSHLALRSQVACQVLRWMCNAHQDFSA